ncbi:hypothetical protein Rhe02_32720 [Rhizocola hellebori]|uniref:Uncharacterized protein n=2 Tax=Rhizocola hellebori TaxID=1392758 RepID=A0A8J3Q7E8_9ACTN|nr:hypothetical protein Rhe02_32720 [Rhizocola hellebori]
MVGQQTRQRRQHHPILSPQVRAVYLPTRHRHLMPQHLQLDVLGATIAASWVSISRIWRKTVYTNEADMPCIVTRLPRTNPHVTANESD